MTILLTVGITLLAATTDVAAGLQSQGTAVDIGLQRMLENDGRLLRVSLLIVKNATGSWRQQNCNRKALFAATKQRNSQSLAQRRHCGSFCVMSICIRFRSPVPVVTSKESPS